MKDILFIFPEELKYPSDNIPPMSFSDTILKAAQRASLLEAIDCTEHVLLSAVDEDLVINLNLMDLYDLSVKLDVLRMLGREKYLAEEDTRKILNTWLSEIAADFYAINGFESHFPKLYLV